MTAHLDLMMKLGKSGATLLLPLYAFKEQPVTTLSASKTVLNTFTAVVDLSRFNNSCLKSRQRRP